jgi:hypothetical protein
MAGFTKVFSRILDSTIWREDDKTRILWITMLALADRDGNVFMTIPGLADRARITLAECEKGLHRFQQPDEYSWSKEAQGRRITTIDGGWFLINHAKYRALMSTEDRREKVRKNVAAWRERQKLQSVTVTKSNQSNHIAEADAEASAIKSKDLPRVLDSQDQNQKPSSEVNAMEVAIVLCQEHAITGIEERHVLKNAIINEAERDKRNDLMQIGQEIMAAWCQHKEGKFVKQFSKFIKEGLFKKKPKPKEVDASALLRQQIAESEGIPVDKVRL